LIYFSLEFDLRENIILYLGEQLLKHYCGRQSTNNQTTHKLESLDMGQTYYKLLSIILKIK
jgi:hypothetical protein